MKSKTYFASILTAGFMLSLNAWAATSGCCNSDCTCSWQKNGTALTITGTGSDVVMQDYQSISNGTSAPWGTDVTSVEITGGITHIGNYAFRFAENLESAVIPDSVTSIGNGAFQRNLSLTNIDLPSNLQSIGGLAFSNSGLVNVEIPSSVSSMGSMAFYWAKNLNDVKFETDEYGNSALTSIGDSAFLASTLSSVELPNSLTSIAANAFGNTPNLTSIDLPDALTSIGNNAFGGSGLISIDLPDGLTSIGDNVFYNTGLTEVTIPDSVTSIGYNAFRNTQLTDVTIPASVISIGEGAFAIAGLQNITFEGDYVSFSTTSGAGYGLSGEQLDNIFALWPGGASNLQNLYCTKEMTSICQKLLHDTSVLLGTSSAQLITYEKDGSYYVVDGNRYSSLENMKKGQTVKRIYTVEEASKVSKPTGNTFKIRYK